MVIVELPESSPTDCMTASEVGPCKASSAVRSLASSKETSEGSAVETVLPSQ